MSGSIVSSAKANVIAPPNNNILDEDSTLMPSPPNKRKNVMQQKHPGDSLSKPAPDSSSAGFLASMTFASVEHIARCDCDECGFSSGVDRLARSNDSVIPLSSAQALDRYKKQRSDSLRRIQDRTLIKRYQESSSDSQGSSTASTVSTMATLAPSPAASVWELTMPLDAEPLVEFGTNHRLIWIKRLPTGSVLKSIGSGIIGSSDEEKQRQALDEWKQGQVWFVPSNGGRAVGWIHTIAMNCESSATSPPSHAPGETSPRTYASLVIAKFPLEQIAASSKNMADSTSDEEDSSPSSWFPRLLTIVRRVLEEHSDNQDSGGWRLNDEDVSVAIQYLS